ncbi:GNAT family N-acetyltransferase [Salimicrobium halophilum]|uniref:Acetyltransferase (GNAT) family protein n=1 Tax=Salimicrobium halophilum TaxID=86666 RepID=A0A1G8V7N2_9BACI|nr:GNAT family N-acetyltransferase [Salimicrobium halophilum]SDJ61894.1 Acetyltransferase (GNAT) family protein [Salimicrobium halophilum]
MNVTMKQLTEQDKPSFASMSTGIEDDYIARIFERLVTSDVHTLYGMFQQGQLVSTAGYSLFAEGTYAMLGRLRSDLNHRGKGYSTELLHHIIHELRKRGDIEWIGANTETTNPQGRRVLEKLGMTPYGPLTYTVVPRSEFEKLPSSEHEWIEVQSTSEKEEIIKTLHPDRLFPYECYYPFPLSDALLREFRTDEARLFLHPDEQRYVLLKEDFKGYEYTNVIYPFSDAATERGLHQIVKAYLDDHPDHYGAWFNQTTTDAPLPFKKEARGEWLLYRI